MCHKKTQILGFDAATFPSVPVHPLRIRFHWRFQRRVYILRSTMHSHLRRSVLKDARCDGIALLRLCLVCRFSIYSVLQPVR